MVDYTLFKATKLLVNVFMGQQLKKLTSARLITWRMFMEEFGTYCKVEHIQEKRILWPSFEQV